MTNEMFAMQLCEAETKVVQIDSLTGQNPDVTIEEAYEIQLLNIKKRVEAGEKIIGMKIGITSRGMQQLLGVFEPDYGHLMDNMLLENQGELPVSELLQPKVEGELAFVLKEELKGPSVTAEDVIAATDYVSPSLEIVDSRIKDWKIKLCDTIADNGSSARLVLGDTKADPKEVDMLLTGMAFYKNDTFINSGVFEEVSGNPAGSVAWLVNKLSEFNITLPAGSIVLSGAVTAAVEAKQGDLFTAKFAGLGEVSLKFV